MSTRVALLTIDAIIAPLTVFDKRATDTVFARVYMSTVSNSLGIISAVTQVAISTLIPIIGVFTVFTFVLKDMRDRTLKKELSRLIKKRSIKIRLRGKRICWGEPTNKSCTGQRPCSTTRHAISRPSFSSSRSALPAIWRRRLPRYPHRNRVTGWGHGSWT